MRSLIIGIAGGSCSGKTTLAREIKDRLTGLTEVIQHDNYYVSRAGIPEEERKKINYDHPDALETALLVRHLKDLKAGKHVECPVYDFTVHERKSETRLLEPLPLILVDGILILQNAQLRRCFDYTVFVDAAADIRLKRRVQRDTRTRGRQPEDVIRQFYETVNPMYKQFVEPFKKYADVVVSDGKKEDVIDKIIRMVT